MTKASAQLSSERLFAEINGAKIPVLLRRPATARRITLKIDVIERSVILTMPKRCRLNSGLKFIDEKADWLAHRLATLPPLVPFVDGTVIPFLGHDHQITHAPDARAGVWRESGRIYVSGSAHHLPRRVKDWLRAEARRDISALAHNKAAQVGEKPNRISIRDTRSRWGSCSSAGNLNFSWRLIFAPRFVLDYVVAHEVAHLKEMNHGPRFWAHVAKLTQQVDEAKRWLRHHGDNLHAFGASVS